MAPLAALVSCLHQQNWTNGAKLHHRCVWCEQLINPYIGAGNTPVIPAVSCGHRRVTVHSKPASLPKQVPTSLDYIGEILSQQKENMHTQTHIHEKQKRPFTKGLALRKGRKLCLEKQTGYNICLSSGWEEEKKLVPYHRILDWTYGIHIYKIRINLKEVISSEAMRPIFVIGNKEHKFFLKENIMP